MAMNNLSLAEQLQRHSHRICSLILNSDLEWIDISFEINIMRDLCEDAAPEKLELFDAVYVSRFMRLWEQWRTPTQIHENRWRPNVKEWGEDDANFSGDEDDGWGLVSA